MAGPSDLCAVETLGGWCAAWRFVTEASAARLYGVDVDVDAFLAEYDKDDVIRVLLQLAWAVLDSLGPDRAAQVVRRWGAVVAVAKGVTSGG